jgi:hypothetical protein
MKAGDRVQMFRSATVVDCGSRELYTAAKGTPGFVHEMAPRAAMLCAAVELIAPGLRPGQLFLVNFVDLELAPGHVSGELVTGAA